MPAQFDYEALGLELASREQAGLFAGMAYALGVLPDPDPVLRDRGDDAAILADLAADEQVSCAMMARKYRVLNRRDFAYQPGRVQEKESGGSAAIAEDLRADMENWVIGDVLAAILDAPFYGFTPLELMWWAEAGRWRLVDVRPRPPEWFAFDAQNRPVWRGAGLGTATALPPGKFVFARHFPSYQNPYGLRLLSRCLWPCAFKKGGIRFYVGFLEKWGIPWTVGTAPPKATRQEKALMAADLDRMIRSAVAVIPAGAAVNLHSVTGSEGELHERFLSRWDAAISKVLMGQTLTAEIGDVGSYGAAQTHQGVADDIAEADRRLVEGVMNEIGWLYAQINAPSLPAPLFVYEEQEDLATRAELDTKLHNLGLRFTRSYFERVYGLGAGDFTLADNGAPPNFAAPSQPEAGAQEEMDGMVDAACKTGAARAGADLCAPFERALAKAESFDEAAILLGAALGETPEALETSLHDLMLGSASFGQAAVAAEEKEGGNA